METTNDKKHDGPGAPTKYKPEYNIQVEKLCKLGATDKELADFFNVTEQTVNNWKISEPEFFESIKRGKILADSMVADRLFQRAIGYEHDDEEIKVVPIGNNQGSEVQRVPVRKYYPPDSTAAIFWMKNRRKTEWRDSQNIDHTTKGKEIQTKFDFSGLDPDKIRAMASELKKARVDDSTSDTDEPTN